MTGERSLDFGLPHGWGGDRIVLPYDIPLSTKVGHCVLLLAFVAPAWFILGEAGDFFHRGNTIAGTFFSLFLIAWCGPMLLTLLHVLRVLGGTEVLVMRPGRVTIHAGAFGVYFGQEYPVEELRNPRVREAEPAASNAWRGRHLVFDHGEGTAEIGANLDRDAVEAVLHAVDAAGAEATASETASATSAVERVRRAVAAAAAAGRAAAAAVTPPGTTAVPSAAAAAAPEAGTVPRARGPLLNLPRRAAASARRLVPGTAAGAAAAGAGPRLDSPSSIALLLANLVPLAGTLFFGWHLVDVMLVYWAESGVIGFYNVLKMVAVGGPGGFVLAVFFIGHYGGFMLGHLIFILAIFFDGAAFGMESPDSSDVAGVVWVVGTSLAAMFVSHGISFAKNFLGGGERDASTLGQLMFAPYKRIVAMHVTILLGGGIATVIGHPAPVLVALVILKTAIDLRAHLREHAAG